MADQPDHQEGAEQAAANAGQSSDSEEVTLAGALLGAVFLLAVFGGGIYGLVQLAPDEAPDKADPSFVDTLFNNTVVIAAGRVVLLASAIVAIATAIYILGSIVHRVGRGEWLREAGPFKAGVIDEKLEESSDYFDEFILADDGVQVLTERLEQTDDLIQALLQENDQLRQTLDEERRSL